MEPQGNWVPRHDNILHINVFFSVENDAVFIKNALKQDVILL